jgi:starch phosphorylase
MTELALKFSGFVNGVSMRHGEVSRGMFPNHNIDAITNGVHATTWAAAPLAELYDRTIPEWRSDNYFLRYAIGIPVEEIRQAHNQAKKNFSRCVGSPAFSSMKSIHSGFCPARHRVCEATCYLRI